MLPLHTKTENFNIQFPKHISRSSLLNIQIITNSVAYIEKRDVQLFRAVASRQIPSHVDIVILDDSSNDVGRRHTFRPLGRDKHPFRLQAGVHVMAVVSLVRNVVVRDEVNLQLK